MYDIQGRQVQKKLLRALANHSPRIAVYPNLSELSTLGHFSKRDKPLRLKIVRSPH